MANFVFATTIPIVGRIYEAYSDSSMKVKVLSIHNNGYDDYILCKIISTSAAFSDRLELFNDIYKETAADKDELETLIKKLEL